MYFMLDVPNHTFVAIVPPSEASLLLLKKKNCTVGYVRFKNVQGVHFLFLQCIY